MTHPDWHPASDARDTLDELVFEYLERVGEEGLEVLEGICADHPEQADELRARVAVLCDAGLVDATASQAKFPDRLGDFRLKRRLGSGGMGVVYLASQESLGRDVALKLIRPEQLYFPGARARFRREVEAVARLTHPGIVAVHTVGEEGGVPYFAMEWVAGASLDEILSEMRASPKAPESGRDLFDAFARAMARSLGEEGRSHGAGGEPRADEPLFAGTWVQTCLWIARELAQALEHAHQRGVLHRDIKPSNVMLTPAGRTLLLDFGLASTQGAARITQTGARAGSLAYMAPEQVRGEIEGIDPRTDVYGLGVTLYEILALRPAFSAPSSARLGELILSARPTPLRDLVRGLPADVEIVVAKAMAPEREQRYASAADFARDLTHLLEHRPIEARPVGAWLRTVRWTQRRPAAATALALGSAIAIGGPILFGIQQRSSARTQLRLNTEIARERDVAREQRARAEHHFATALEAVDEMLTRVGDERLKDVPRAAEVRRELLESALSFYRGFLREHPGDPSLIAESLRVQARCADVLALLGQGDEAQAAYARAQAGLSAEAGSMEERERWRLMARTAHGRARQQMLANRPAEAEATLRAALQELAGVEGGTAAGLSPLRTVLAEALQSQGDSDGAIGILEQECEVLEPRTAPEGTGDAGRREWGNALSTLASTYAACGRFEQSRATYERTLAVIEDLLSRAPEDFELRAHLVRTHLQLARTGAGRDAAWREAHVLSAVRETESLREGFVELPRLQEDCAGAMIAQGVARSERGDFAGARAAYLEARNLLEALVAAHPLNVEYRGNLARALSNQFAIEFDAGNVHEALGFLDLAESRLREALAAGAGNPALAEVQLSVRFNRGNALLALGQHREAVAALEELPDWPQWQPYLSAASICVRALKRLAEDDAIDEAEQEQLEGLYVQRATDFVVRGVSRGYTDVDNLRENALWEPLRGLAAFDELVDGLARPVRAAD